MTAGLPGVAESHFVHYTPIHALSVQYLGCVEGQGTPRARDKGRHSGFPSHVLESEKHFTQWNSFRPNKKKHIKPTEYKREIHQQGNKVNWIHRLSNIVWSLWANFVGEKVLVGNESPSNDTRFHVHPTSPTTIAAPPFNTLLVVQIDESSLEVLWP